MTEIWGRYLFVNLLHDEIQIDSNQSKHFLSHGTLGLQNDTFEHHQLKSNTMLQYEVLNNQISRNEAVDGISFKVRLLKRSISFYKRQMEVLEELLKEWNFNEDAAHHKEDVAFFLLQLGRCRVELARRESSLVMIGNRGYHMKSKQDSEELTKLLTRISRQVNQLENEIAELNKQIRTYLIDFAS